jgi:hypothetical protein
MKDKSVLYQKMCEELDGKTNLGVNFDTVKRSFLYGGSLPCSYYYISGFGNTEMIERFMSYMLQNREGAARLREDPKGFLETVLPYTAYSMSAGGPIVDPRMECFCVTPICPHSLTARPMLFGDSVTLEVKNVCQREKMLYLTVDGRINFELYRGDTVRITRSPMITRLIRLREEGFYARLQDKMKSYT